jgi:hypothetical protein
VAEQAEEVAAPTDPKTHAKIAVTETIRNTTKDFDGENFIINGKTYTFKTEGVSVLMTLRSFCNKNGIRTDDGKSLHNANRGAVKGAIKDKHRRINADEEDPCVVVKKESKKDKDKAAPLNQFRLANVMYGEAMKEALQNKGASLTKDELIISSAGSKSGDRDFYKAAMKEYNKEKHDEYDTLHLPTTLLWMTRTYQKCSALSMTGAT